MCMFMCMYMYLCECVMCVCVCVCVCIIMSVSYYVIVYFWMSISSHYVSLFAVFTFGWFCFILLDMVLSTQMVRMVEHGFYMFLLVM